MRTSFALLLIVLVGLGVRISYLASNQRVYPDDGLVLAQGEMARNIVNHGRWFVVNEVATRYVAKLQARAGHLIDPADVNYRPLDSHPRWQAQIVTPVGEAVMLAGLWKLTGSERYLPLQILQIVIDTLMVLLVYRIAVQLFKRRSAALVAAAMYALFLPIAWLSTDPNIDIWCVDFTLMGVAAYIEAMQSAHRLRWLVACGVAVGVGSYFRPNLLILPVALALATLVWSGWREALRCAAIPLAIAALLVIPWTIRNANEFHRFIPTSSGFGQTLWEGLGEVHNDFGAVLNDGITYAQVHRERPSLIYGSPAYDDYLRHKAIQAIEHHPTTYANAIVHRIAITTVASLDSGWMHGGTTLPARYRSQTGSGLLSYAINRPLDMLQVVLQPVVFLLAILGLAFTWQGRLREHALLIAVVLATLIPYWAIHVESRYVLPATFAYILWIALGADMAAERLTAWGRRRWERPAG
jgi:4-amino-4-deoxy-L-arabinose transferase-like glycosyltransferase